MKKSIKTIMVILVMFFAYAFLYNTDAASASISASKTSASVGDKITVSVKINAAAWEIHLSGAASGSFADVSSDGNNTSKSESVSFTPSSAGTYTVKMSGNVTDGSKTTPDNVSGSVTITVSEKSSNSDSNNKTDTTKTTDTEKKSEPTFKSANDTMYATGDINVRKSYSADSDKIGSLKAGDKITRTGIGDNGWSKVSYNGATGYIKTSLLTDKEPKKSDDKALKSLSIDGLEIDPAFDPEITDYTVTFEDKDKLDIKAEPNSDKAKVEITGNDALKDGDNVIKVTVTAEDETTRIYTIVATKGDAKAGLLSTLKVAGYTLSPAFSSSIKEYKITILDANVNKLDITAESSIEKAKVEVLGNTNLKDGDNVIQIKVTSPDGSKTDTYKIIATKGSTSGTTTGNTENKSTNWVLYAGIGIIVLLIIAIIVVFIMSKRNAYYEDDEDYEDEDEAVEDNEPKDDYSDLYGYSTKSEVKNVEPDASNNVGEATPKYEDGFNYNAFNSQNVYGDVNNKSEEQSGVKDVDYYSNKVSEMFDAPEAKENKTTDDAFGYLPKDEPAQEIKDEYTPLDNNWSDDNYKPRRSKGKHSK